MIVTATKFAEMLGKSPAWVSHQIALGMPATGSGHSGSPYKIDTGLATEWILDFASPPGPVDRKEKNFLLRDRADMIGRLEAMPARLAKELAVISDARTVKAKLLAEVERIRGGDDR